MASTVFAASDADQIYLEGPEVLVARSRVVVAGTLTHYTKAETSTSQGTEPIPLTWTVSGQVDQPLAIKGAVPAPPISFSRLERSLIVPPDPAMPTWQLDYGDLLPQGTVVLFFHGSAEEPSLAVLPGGNHPQALIGLLRDIVSIQAIGSPAEQVAAWLEYLSRAHTDEAKKVALRSLVHLAIPWTSFAPEVERLAADPATSADARGYLFGILTFSIKHDKFGPQQVDALRFLCDEFLAHQDARLSLQYILNLKILLSYTSESNGHQARLPLEHMIIETLKRRASMGSMPPAIAEQYRQIQETHPRTR